jgi:lipopolysaccharide transport system permease protein
MLKVTEQIKGIWDRRDLIKYFVRADLKIIYKNKLIGFLWTILDPLMLMLVYILLVVIIFKRGGPQFPILLFSALLAWKWFTYSLEGSVTSVTNKASLIQSVYFPKAVLPLTRVIIGLINYLFGLIALIPLLFIFEAKLTLNLLWLPVLIFIQLIFTVGAALFCAALGIYFRDLENIMEFGLRIWFYLSPALYSVTGRIPGRFVSKYMLNPFAALFESYKNILVRGLPPSKYMLIAAGLAVFIFISGFILFRVKESDFAKDV